jgi:hypothetical protein
MPQTIVLFGSKGSRIKVFRVAEENCSIVKKDDEYPLDLKQELD